MSAWQRARGLIDRAGSGLRKAGEKYSAFAEQAARPLMREYDARQMSPDQRAGLAFSQRQGTQLDSTDQNIIGRLMISDPSDAAANRLLEDKSFAAAIGSTPEALKKQRQQTLEAIALADNAQAARAPQPTEMYGVSEVPALDSNLRVSTLLEQARKDGSNESVTRLLEAVSDPLVMRPANPQEWDAQGNMDIPNNADFQERMMMDPRYLNPQTGERVQRKPMPVPPGEQKAQVEHLSEFLNRAYPPQDATVSLGGLEQAALKSSGGFNRDFADVTAADAQTIAGQAFRDLDSMRGAVQGVEGIGLTAADRLGYTSVAERLRKAEGLKGRSKIHDSSGNLQDIALQRLAERQQQLNRQLSKGERAELLNELNDELPDVAFDLGLGALDKSIGKELKPKRFAADVMKAADRAGFSSVNVPDIEKSGLRQPTVAYISDDARDLNRVITNPVTGVAVGGTALLGTAMAIQAAINNQRKDELEFNRDITGHAAFSKTIPQEVNYVLKGIDPEVLSEILNR